ncbi:unnamed protein product [Ixodes pacificus]
MPTLRLIVYMVATELAMTNGEFGWRIVGNLFCPKTGNTVRVVSFRPAPPVTFRRFFCPSSTRPSEQAPDCIWCRHFQNGREGQ